MTASVLYCDHCAKDISGMKQVFMLPPTDKVVCSKECAVAILGAWDYHDTFECDENCDCHDPNGKR